MPFFGKIFECVNGYTAGISDDEFFGSSRQDPPVREPVVEQTVGQAMETVSIHR